MKGTVVMLARVFATLARVLSAASTRAMDTPARVIASLKTRASLIMLILAIFLPLTAICQKKISLQVKTFDESMRPVGNIEVALNDSGYFMIGSKGTAIVELSESDAKIISVRVKDETIEPASWNVSKGVVEIVVRPKSYRVHRFVLRLPDGKGVPGASITFQGSSTIKSKTDPAGRFVLQLPVKEPVRSADQFRVQDFQVTGLALSETESVLNIVKLSAQVPAVVQQPLARKKEIKEDVTPEKPPLKQAASVQASTLDTISSLTSFYAFVRNTPMSSLAVKDKIMLDEKFKELMTTERAMITASADSGLNEDIDTLPREAVSENDTVRSAQRNFGIKTAGEEQQSLLVIGIIVAFAVLLILLIILYSKLREKTLALKNAKRQVEHDNEDTEDVDDIVKRETRLLSESTRELNTFLNRSSQELRSMLRSVILLFKIIENTQPQELVDRVDTATAGMDRILDKLIDISREPGNAEQVKVIEVIKSVKDKHLTAVADHAGRPLQFKINCPDDVTLFINRSLLETVLSNLVENAIHFSTIKDATEPAIVEISVVTRGDMLELSVYDNGVGISNAAKPKVFNMFFKSHEEAEGNGLGLYAVRKAVLAMHGKVDIMTEEGVFTRVVVMIPRGKQTLKRAAEAREEVSLSM